MIGENSCLQSTIAGINDQLKTKDKEISDLKEHDKKLKDTNGELEARHDKDKEALQEKYAEIFQLKEELETANRECQSVKDTMTELKADNISLQSKIVDINDQLKNKEQVIVLEQQVHEFEQSQADLQADVTEIEHAQAEVQDEIQFRPDLDTSIMEQEIISSPAITPTDSKNMEGIAFLMEVTVDTFEKMAEANPVLQVPSSKGAEINTLSQPLEETARPQCRTGKSTKATTEAVYDRGIKISTRQIKTKNSRIIDRSIPHIEVERNTKLNRTVCSCGKSFKKRSDFKKHATAVEYPCGYQGCTTSLKSKHSLDHHIKVIHFKMEPYSCPKCGETFRSRRAINAHKVKKKPLTCELHNFQ